MRNSVMEYLAHARLGEADDGLVFANPSSSRRTYQETSKMPSIADTPNNERIRWPPTH